MSLSDTASLPSGDSVRVATPSDRTALLDEFLRRTRERHEAMVDRLEALSLQRDEVLFDGEWMDAAEAARRHRGLRFHQMLQMAELAVLVVGIMAAGGVCLLLLLLLYL